MQYVVCHVHECTTVCIVQCLLCTAPGLSKKPFLGVKHPRLEIKIFLRCGWKSKYFSDMAGIQNILYCRIKHSVSPLSTLEEAILCLTVLPPVSLDRECEWFPRIAFVLRGFLTRELRTVFLSMTWKEAEPPNNIIVSWSSMCKKSNF